MKQPIIYKPLPKYGHNGDSFREMIDLWEIKGLCTVVASPDRFCWWGKPGDVLLYDYPRITDHPAPPARHILYSNMGPDEPAENWSWWSFWPRRPRLIEKYLASDPVMIVPHERMFKSTFVGRTENQVQKNNRFNSKIDWEKWIQNYRVVDGVNTPYPYDAAAYLHVMTKTKFAFLLPGYGPKCNRDIEAMACGCVPVVTPGVCTNYFDDWKEGDHFVRVKSEADLKKLDRIKPEKLVHIQQNVLSWYRKNASTEGLFRTTQQIIESLPSV